MSRRTNKRHNGSVFLDAAKTTEKAPTASKPQFTEKEGIEDGNCRKIKSKR